MTWILAPADPQTYFIWNTSEWDDAGTLWGYA
jgi:hypothetical protein